MNYNSPKKERSNNILFLLFLFLFICFPLTQSLSPEIEGVWYVLYYFFLSFSGMIYGFISKNPLKSFFIGSLPLSMAFGVNKLIADLINPTSEPLNEYLRSNISGIGTILFYLILGGLTAIFMVQESENSKKIINRYLSVFVILSVFFYFTFFGFYSFEDNSFGFNPMIGIMITLIGLSGCFMAQKSENRWKRQSYIILSFLCLLILLIGLWRSIDLPFA